MSSLKICNATGNILSCVDISIFGTDLRDISDLCNIPTLVPKNVFGKETYISVLEPVEELRPDSEFIKPSVNYKTVGDLVNAFFEYVKKYENSEEKVVEIMFLGYKYLWRPRHKTHYGTYAKEYLIQPIIARYYFAIPGNVTYPFDITDALPYKYHNSGTGKGVFSRNLEFDGPVIVKGESETDTTFNAVDGFFTHLNSISGFNKPMVAMKVGKAPIEEIWSFLDYIKKEAGITIEFNTQRVLDKCRTKDFEGFCLIGYKQDIASTKNVKVIKLPEHPNVSLFVVQAESTENVTKIFESEIGDDIEVV